MISSTVDLLISESRRTFSASLWFEQRGPDKAPRLSLVTGVAGDGELLAPPLRPTSTRPPVRLLVPQGCDPSLPMFHYQCHRITRGCDTGPPLLTAAGGGRQSTPGLRGLSCLRRGREGRWPSPPYPCHRLHRPSSSTFRRDQSAYSCPLGVSRWMT